MNMIESFKILKKMKDKPFYAYPKRLVFGNKKPFIIYAYQGEGKYYEFHRYSLNPFTKYTKFEDFNVKAQDVLENWDVIKIEGLELKRPWKET